MIIGLMAAGAIAVALVTAGLWMMTMAGTEPAARSNGRAPDLSEEDEASASDVRGWGILARAPAD